ncbi:hypothetical protein MNR01_12425 [Lysobacter sp. S4-A87]|uniref:hypothetical protein n=1 Tax=Lysobacter sp. S4-A87 TaxID=2925843 RepID=UPI001F538D69|nr:hypothetical protein [Lysobacter sp. S4-A87]UNK48551.1 hypothetical protein MNR01_12425 [Lysobacter sp. S4-A87]
MKALFLVAACAALLHSPPVSADCTLAFAPAAMRRAASEHYYRSTKRDAIPPGQLPPGSRPAADVEPFPANTPSSTPRAGDDPCRDRAGSDCPDPEAETQPLG